MNIAPCQAASFPGLIVVMVVLAVVGAAVVVVEGVAEVRVGGGGIVAAGCRGPYCYAPTPSSPAGIVAETRPCAAVLLLFG